MWKTSKTRNFLSDVLNCIISLPQECQLDTFWFAINVKPMPIARVRERKNISRPFRVTHGQKWDIWRPRTWRAYLIGCYLTATEPCSSVNSAKHQRKLIFFYCGHCYQQGGDWLLRGQQHGFPIYYVGRRIRDLTVQKPNLLVWLRAATRQITNIRRYHSPRQGCGYKH